MLRAQAIALNQCNHFVSYDEWVPEDQDWVSRFHGFEFYEEAEAAAVECSRSVNIHHIRIA